MQAKALDPCIYYDCEDHLWPVDDDSDCKQGTANLLDQSFEFDNARYLKADGRTNLEGIVDIIILLFTSLSLQQPPPWKRKMKISLCI